MFDPRYPYLFVGFTTEPTDVGLATVERIVEQTATTARSGTGSLVAKDLKNEKRLQYALQLADMPFTGRLEHVALMLIGHNVVESVEFNIADDDIAKRGVTLGLIVEEFLKEVLHDSDIGITVFGFDSIAFLELARAEAAACTGVQPTYLTRAHALVYDPFTLPFLYNRKLVTLVNENGLKLIVRTDHCKRIYTPQMILSGLNVRLHADLQNFSPRVDAQHDVIITGELVSRYRLADAYRSVFQHALYDMKKLAGVLTAEDVPPPTLPASFTVYPHIVQLPNVTTKDEDELAAKKRKSRAKASDKKNTPPKKRGRKPKK